MRLALGTRATTRCQPSPNEVSRRAIRADRRRPAARLCRIWPAGADVGYDDYAGIDVADKAVLIFSHEPQETDPNSPLNGTGPMPQTTLACKKRQLARSHRREGTAHRRRSDAHRPIRVRMHLFG